MPHQRIRERPRSSRTGVARCPIGILLLVALFLASPAAVPAAGAAPASANSTATSASDPYGAVIPALRAQVMRSAGPLSAYTINATLDPRRRTLSGHEQITFVNRTGSAVAGVYFRLFPNAPYYGASGLTVAGLTVAGRTVAPELAVEDTALRAALPAPLSPGATVALAFDFTTTIPADSTGSYGILNDDTRDGPGTWVVSDWYPILAGYEPGRGWNLDPPTSFGDPTFADEALYDVTLVVPANLTVVAGGSEVGQATADDGAGTVRRRYVDGPARDFTFVAASDYAAVSQRVGGTTVNVYTSPAGAAGRQAALKDAATALAVYSAHLGTYPFRELDLVETRLAGAAGVSWTGLVFLDRGRLAIDPSADEAQVAALRFTVAHEIGHQWWGMSVGANSNAHTFMVEGLTNYTAVLEIAWTDGDADAKTALDQNIVRPYLALLADGNDGVADIPVANGQNGAVRGAIIYGKGALGFLAIRDRIGDDAFFRGLRDYATTYAYRIATPADLRAAFATASGQNLDALWSQWFDSAGMTPQEVDAVVAAAP